MRERERERERETFFLSLSLFPFHLLWKRERDRESKRDGANKKATAFRELIRHSLVLSCVRACIRRALQKIIGGYSSCWLLAIVYRESQRMTKKRENIRIWGRNERDIKNKMSEKWGPPKREGSLDSKKGNVSKKPTRRTCGPPGTIYIPYSSVSRTDFYIFVFSFCVHVLL